MTPLDMSYLLLGYLRLPDGRLHFVHGLDVIARDMLAAGVAVYWGEESMRDAGRCDCRRRRIILAPWLTRMTGSRVRCVCSHELGHAVLGPSDERVRLWQRRMYGEMLTPVWAA